MRCLLFAILLLAAPLGAFALTWDFDEGTTWGWAAQESWLGNLGGVVPTTVYSEVEEGVWRIAPVPGAQQPAISLLSPLIGEDSDLFDWLTLRLRIIHDRPTGGNLLMKWSNGESRRRTLEMEPSGTGEIPTNEGFYTGRYQYYPIEWENITIDIRLGSGGGSKKKRADYDYFSGHFLHLARHPLLLATRPRVKPRPPGAGRSSGLCRNRLDSTDGGRRAVVRRIAASGDCRDRAARCPVCCAAFFCAGRGIGEGLSQGTLGDVDGDGDADLVVVWTYYTTVQVTEERYDTTVSSGWTIAASDGLGDFVPTREVFRSDSDGLLLEVEGGDFNGDGLLDLAFVEGLTTALWLNQGKNNFETILQLSDVFFEALVDGDGDGDVDLLVVGYDPLRDDAIWSEAIMWINDGAAGFAQSDRFVLDTKEELVPLLLAGHPLGEAVRLLWTRQFYEDGGPLLLTQPWAASQSPPLFF